MQKDNDLPARGRSDCRQTPNKTRGLSLFLCIFSINQQKKGRRCSRLGLFDPSLLAFVKEAAFGIGGGLCNGGGIAGRVFRWFEVVFSVCVSIVGNFFFQLLLVAAHEFFHHVFLFLWRLAWALTWVASTNWRRVSTKPWSMAC